MPVSSQTAPLKKLTKGMGLYQVIYWPAEAKKAGYPNKPWAVVNLRTGDVNGRYHATKEEASAQARALYAKLGDKAKVQSESGTGIASAYFFSADPATLLDGTDNGIKWVEAIGDKTYSVPAYGDVVIDSSKIDRFISNLNDNVRGQEIAINYEHGLDPAKGKKAAGWIRGARKNQSGNLELAVEFTEPAKQEIINKEWKYFSLEWDDMWEHPDGIVYEDVVMGGALTNRPVAKDLMPINFSEIFAEVAGSDYEFAVWSTAYVNSLPDSSFAWIEPGGTKTGGKTDSAHRHLPYKDASGKVDLAHVRNMLARVSQVKGIPPAVVSRVKALGERLLGAKNMAEIDEIDAKYMAEQDEYSRSDPGVVAPIYDGTEQPDPGTGHFVPRDPGDPNADPAISGGWRRQTPPIAMSEDVFKFTEEQAREFMGKAATALDAYVTEETTADDNVTARGLLSAVGELMDKDTIKYSEYTGICAKIKRFFQKKDIENKHNESNETKQFTEAEAIGYLTASVKALDKIHTNDGNALIDRIEVVLNKDYRERSFSELQTLVNETRTMLRGEDITDSNIATASDTTTIPSKGGNTVGELTEKDLRELRNVLDVEDDGKILEAVQHKFGELAQLRDAVSASEQERVFAEQYPQFYAEHRKMLERDRRNTAKDFSESVAKVRQAEGLGLKTTKLGLSSKASETLIEAHMKFAEGQGTLEDFEGVVKALMHGGLVQFGEAGSSGEDELPEVDGNTAVGVAAGRKVFAEAIAREQASNPELSYSEAISVAAKKHPDLADLYKVTLPA